MAVSQEKKNLIQLTQLWYCNTIIAVSACKIVSPKKSTMLKIIVRVKLYKQISQHCNN